MNGVDAIAFTAGIGENTSFVREKIMAYLGYLGIKIDHVTNDKTRGVEALISTADSSVKVCVIPVCPKNRMYEFLYPVCLWYLSVFHSVIAFVPPEINYRSCVQHRNRAIIVF